MTKPSLDASLLKRDIAIPMGGLFGFKIPSDEAPFVVPFESHTSRVGIRFFEDLAKSRSGIFKRDEAGSGLMSNFDVLSGPTFSPAKVHPLIREFYENTSEFLLTVRPVWHPLYLPAFLVFRKALARHVGQANLPFDMKEALQGIVSHIETIDFDKDAIVDLTGWVRYYKETQEPIYVGIYTTFRSDDVGYVSVGFPLPECNFTATLVPTNVGGDGFLLRSRFTGTRYAGHYLVWLDNETRSPTVLKIDGFSEEIQVYVAQKQLLTDHRFYFLGDNFLTLYYTIDRKV